MSFSPNPLNTEQPSLSKIKIKHEM